MSYTRKEILAMCEDAFTNKDTFYTKPFINYRGTTTDTAELFTEVVAEFLLQNLEAYKTGITQLNRTYPYTTPTHDGQFTPGTGREEEHIAMEIFNQSKAQGGFPLVGQILDYQTPLKATSKDKAGKIDLLSCDGKTMRILELKKPASEETMLRCVLEGFTYLNTVDSDKLIDDFAKVFDFTPSDITLKANPLVFYEGEQHKEMREDRPKLRELMASLDSTPLYVKKIDTATYEIVKG